MMNIDEQTIRTFLAELAKLLKKFSTSLVLDAVIVMLNQKEEWTVFKEIYTNDNIEEKNYFRKNIHEHLGEKESLKWIGNTFKLNILQGNHVVGYVIIWQKPNVVCSMNRDQKGSEDYLTKAQFTRITQLICDLSEELPQASGEKILLELEKLEEGNEAVKKEIRKAERFIKCNLHKQLSLSEVASQVYFSQSYFCRLFKKEMGLNFIDYLNRERIYRAKELLINSNLSINEISKRVGFTQTSYFCKIFKESNNVSPAVFRRDFGNLGRVKKEA